MNQEVILAPKWTQDEAINFECAREVITELMAIITEQIAEEEEKESPDTEKLKQLYAESDRLFDERAGIHVKDHEKIARVRSEYGAIVRAYNEV